MKRSSRNLGDPIGSCGGHESSLTGSPLQPKEGRATIDRESDEPIVLRVPQQRFRVNLIFPTRWILGLIHWKYWFY